MKTALKVALGTILALSLIGPPEASARITKLRAEVAVERQVKRLYPHKIRGRLVLAECRRRSRTSYRCVYDVLANGFSDGFEQGLRGEPLDPFVYSGRGSVRQVGGRLIVRVTRPVR